jgi:hypothetical protein
MSASRAAREKFSGIHKLATVSLTDGKIKLCHHPGFLVARVGARVLFSKIEGLRQFHADKTTMEKIYIDFCDLGFNWDKTEIYLYKVLAERFDVRLCDQPDFLVYSCGGHAHRLHTGVKIFFSGESDMSDFRECDYSIASVKLDDPRHIQYPNYVHYGQPEQIIKKDEDAEKILAAKTKFCSFVVAGYNPRKNGNRVEFFQKLSKYKKVDSGGRKFNNIGGPILPGSQAKIDFLRPYKFNIAFENRSLPGYTTEFFLSP